MAITNIEVLIKFLSTAKASYADISLGSLKDSLVNSGSGPDSTETEAQYFVDNCNLINRQQQGTSTDFVRQFLKMK